MIKDIIASVPFPSCNAAWAERYGMDNARAAQLHSISLPAISPSLDDEGIPWIVYRDPRDPDKQIVQFVAGVGVLFYSDLSGEDGSIVVRVDPIPGDGLRARRSWLEDAARQSAAILGLQLTFAQRTAEA